jgi:hypothetical protein
MSGYCECRGSEDEAAVGLPKLASIVAPQFEQNRCPAGTAVPHCGQKRGGICAIDLLLQNTGNTGDCSHYYSMPEKLLIAFWVQSLIQRANRRILDDKNGIPATGRCAGTQERNVPANYSYQEVYQ